MAEPVAPEFASRGIVRATVPVMRSTTATALSSPLGTIATPLSALTLTGVALTPPRGILIAAAGAYTGATPRLTSVLFTTRRTSVAGGAGAVVSAQADMAARMATR